MRNDKTKFLIKYALNLYQKKTAKPFLDFAVNYLSS